jgi:hypothetical protein
VDQANYGFYAGGTPEQSLLLRVIQPSAFYTALTSEAMTMRTPSLCHYFLLDDPAAHNLPV